MPPPFRQQVTFISTADQAASMRFYEEQLGLPLVLDQGACRIYRAGAGAFLGVCRRAGLAAGAGANAPVVITLVSDDVDGWHAHLAARGVVFEKPPTQNAEYNIYHCFLRDPDGYLLEIQQFLDPAWPAE